VLEGQGCVIENTDYGTKYSVQFVGMVCAVRRKENREIVKGSRCKSDNRPFSPLFSLLYGVTALTLDGNKNSAWPSILTDGWGVL
jgi:hypothetical protein